MLARHEVGRASAYIFWSCLGSAYIADDLLELPCSLLPVWGFLLLFFPCSLSGTFVLSVAFLLVLPVWDILLLPDGGIHIIHLLLPISVFCSLAPHRSHTCVYFMHSVRLYSCSLSYVLPMSWLLAACVVRPFAGCKLRSRSPPRPRKSLYVVRPTAGAAGCTPLHHISLRSRRLAAPGRGMR